VAVTGCDVNFPILIQLQAFERSSDPQITNAWARFNPRAEFRQSSLLLLAEDENSGAPQVLMASREPNRMMSSTLERPSRTK
jgi:hypothetical protein